MHIVGVTTKFVKTTPNRGTRSPNAWARYIVSQCIEYRRTRTVLLPAGDEYGHLTTNQLCPQSTVVRAYAKAQGGHFRHKLCAPTRALNHLLGTVPVWELEDIHTSCQNILLIFIRNHFLSVLYIALSSEIVFLVLLLCTVRHSDFAFCVCCLVCICLYTEPPL